MQKPLKNFPFSFGLVHWGFSLFVILAAITSIFVHRKDPLTALPIILHIIVGACVIFLLLCQWILLFVKKHRAVKAHLFPYHIEGRRCILADIHLLLKGRLPPKGIRPGLSGFVEGLGILLLTLMALTGLTYLLGNLFANAPTWTVPFLDVHSFFSGFVWAFIIGHSGMALLHTLIKKA